MYTIGIKGFRFTSLQKIALLVATKKKYKNLVLHFGEIDCRVWSHKLQNMEQIDALTEKYLLRIDELAGLYGFAAVVLISPIPPNDGGHLNLDFPRSGSICERIQITKRMTQSMMSNSKNGSQKIVDSQSLVGYNASSHNYGSLREIYSIDGCHVNLEGAELIRRSIYGFLDSESRF